MVSSSDWWIELFAIVAWKFCFLDLNKAVNWKLLYLFPCLALNFNLFYVIDFGLSFLLESELWKWQWVKEVLRQHTECMSLRHLHTGKRIGWQTPEVWQTMCFHATSLQNCKNPSLNKEILATHSSTASEVISLMFITQKCYQQRWCLLSPTICHACQLLSP